MDPTRAFQKMETQAAKRVYSPRTDIYETDEAIVLRADLPGVEEASLDITLVLLFAVRFFASQRRSRKSGRYRG